MISELMKDSKLLEFKLMEKLKNLEQKVDGQPAEMQDLSHLMEFETKQN